MAHPSDERRPLFVTPFVGGMVGAAQLSTAYILLFPAAGTDVGLTGVGGAYLWWTVPLGSLLGASLCWLLLRLPRRFYNRAAWFRSWVIAAIPGFGAAIIAPMFLGLGPQSQAQLWQGFAVIYGLVWAGIAPITYWEGQQVR